MAQADESQFKVHADACLKKIADWLEQFDADELDFSTSDGQVTLEFGDGTKFVVSRQTAGRQVWLAASARGYHFDYDPTRDTWLDDKDRAELFPRLAEAVSDHLGRPVSFTD